MNYDRCQNEVSKLFDKLNTHIFNGSSFITYNVVMYQTSFSIWHAWIIESNVLLFLLV